MVDDIAELLKKSLNRRRRRFQSLLSRRQSVTMGWILEMLVFGICWKSALKTGQINPQWKNLIRVYPYMYEMGVNPLVFLKKAHKFGC
jgi:hypothetical protein